MPIGPDVAGNPFHDALEQAIASARERVWIVTPYFVPTPLLARGLALAAKRGVDVAILVPERSNHAVADVVRGPALRDAAEAGCRVLLHPGMIHAKAGIVDGLAWVGSANFDVRSMVLNFELALVLEGAAEVAAVEAWMREGMGGAARDLAAPGPGRRLVEDALRLLAPLL